MTVSLLHSVIECRQHCVTLCQCIALHDSVLGVQGHREHASQCQNVLRHHVTRCLMHSPSVHAAQRDRVLVALRDGVPVAQRDRVIASQNARCIVSQSA